MAGRVRVSIACSLDGGVPLFAGTEHRHALERVDVRAMSAGLVRITYRPRA